MARAAKKETSLTTEEKLAKALVPEEEQPYPVPEDWCWMRFHDLCSEIQYGYTAKSIKDDTLPKMLRITDVQDGLVNWNDVPNCQISENEFKKYQLAEGDIVFARTGATTGKSYLITHPPDSVYASYLIRVRLFSFINKKYSYYFLQTSYYWNYITEVSAGIAQPGCNAKKLGKLPFPLPPLPEQQRIVTLIESLFADLDAAKEKLQAVLDGFAKRRAALLHQAFTGELTREWREKNGIRDDSWVEKKLEDCGNWSGGGTPSMSHPEYWDDGVIRWVTSKDMKAEIINDTQMHITAMGEKNSSAKLINSCAVLFVTRSGILRRTLPIAMISGRFTVNQDLKVLEPVNYIDTKYLLRACQSRRQIILDTCMKSGTTVESINFSALKTFVISVCSLPEQKEIVRVLDDVFAKESQSKAAVESALAKIDTMKKAILATAFRGGFDTNESSDESAKDALRRML